MTTEQRKIWAANRARMFLEAQSPNRARGGRLSQYSKYMKKKYGL